MEAARELNLTLAGSPYLLSEEDAGEARATYLVDECKNIEERHYAVEELFRLESAEIQERIGFMVGTNFVFQSNALEFAGQSLAQTQDEIKAIGSDVGRLARHLAEAAVRADRHLVETLGMYRAKIFAEELAAEYRATSRRITEVDVRALHAATMSSESFAGSYRRGSVEISGSSHKPPDAFRVPMEMEQLLSWMNTTSARPALAAAVVHTWLTIIHPFEDGNGRVARLLANVVLLKAGWPPLIIKASDRIQYLDALSASDEAGDLLALFDLFVKSIRRGLKDLERPDLATRLFEADLRRDPDARYDLWTAQVYEFLNELEAYARLDEFVLDRLPPPPRSTFMLLEEHDASGSAWLAKLKHSDGRDFLLWLGYMSIQMNDAWQGGVSPPSVFFDERDDSPSALHRYKTLRRPHALVIDEVSFLPRLSGGQALIRYGLTTLEMPIREAADRVARELAAVNT